MGLRVWRSIMMIASWGKSTCLAVSQLPTKEPVISGISDISENRRNYPLESPSLQ